MKLTNIDHTNFGLYIFLRDVKLYTRKGSLNITKFTSDNL